MSFKFYIIYNFVVVVVFNPFLLVPGVIIKGSHGIQPTEPAYWK